MHRTGFALLSLLALAAVAHGQATPADKFLPEASHDFGMVPRGAQLMHRFPWTNPDKTRKEITEVRLTCGCASATPLPRVLEPGQSGVIEVLVDAKRFVGQKNVTIHLMIGPDKPQAAALQIMAHSRPDIVYNPGQVSFGVVQEGATPTQTLEMEYAGALDWKIEGLVNTSPHLTASVEEMYRKPGQIGYRVTVTLKADVTGGDFKHELQVRTNDPSNPVLPVLVEANVRPSLVMIPDPLFFGTVKAKQSQNRRVTIRGDKPFQILRIEGQGRGLNATTSSGNAQVHTLQVTWNPTETGEMNTQLVIHTNLERHSILRLTVQGEVPGDK